MRVSRGELSTAAVIAPDPGARAAARLWIDWTSNKLVPLFYKLLKGQDSEEWPSIKVDLCDVLQHLDSALSTTGPYLLGDQLSLADLELYPWFERWPVLEHYRSLDIPASLSGLRRWREALAGRPAVAAIAEVPEFYIGQYLTYAEPVLAQAT